MEVTGNSIFKSMGLDRVTGKIFIINPSGDSCSIQCIETGAMELVDFDDGKVVKI